MLKTLLVDGNAILQIGFHGIKNFYHKEKHVGALFHFINTLKRNLVENKYGKVVVFWDSSTSTDIRKELYPFYKANRKKRFSEEDWDSFLSQKNRVCEYLEELFVRQADTIKCEADDAIAYYTQHSPKEMKTIITADKDLCQLVSETTVVELVNVKIRVKRGDKVKFKDIEVPTENVEILKILTGDRSDNIEGISLLGNKTLKKLIPEIETRPITLEEVKSKIKELSKTSNLPAIKNFLEGKTKTTVLGENFFTVNKKIITLESPLISEETKKEVDEIINQSMDPEGRSLKNAIKMMNKDGLYKFLPKTDDSWSNYFRPFLRLSKLEKNKYKKQK